MSSPGPFDRVWAVLRDSALRPGPALAYLVLLALAWPAYRLWSNVPPAALRAPVAVPAVVTPATGDASLRLPPNGPLLLRVPAASLAAPPATLALVRDGLEIWTLPLGGGPHAAGTPYDVLLDGAAFEGGDGVLEFRGADGAVVARFALEAG